MQFAMMEPADWDRVFVADFAVQRARLRKAKVVRLGGCAAAYDARLRGYEFAVLLVAQTNGLPRDAATANNGRFKCRPLGSVEDLALRLRGLVVRNRGSLRRRCARLSTVDHRDPLPEGGLDRLGVSGCQRVLGRKVLVDPFCGLFGGLEAL